MELVRSGAGGKSIYRLPHERRRLREDAACCIRDWPMIDAEIFCIDARVERVCRVRP